VDDPRIGRSLRLLRQRRGWRQRDLAQAAGISQSTIATVEAGHVGTLSLSTLRKVFGAVGASFDSTVRWRGGAIDRLLDERHAQILASAVAQLRRAGWLVAIEVTYSIYGERGSIDVLAGFPEARAVLVEEIKSELVSFEELGRKTDEKRRLSKRVLCRERFGWEPALAGRLVVFPATDTARRAVRRNDALLNTAFPARGDEIRTWLKRPDRDLSGILFVADIGPGGVTSDKRGARRVRRTPSCTTRA
jgi:transcriptional regulator with XRE-family HTH domain